MRGSPPDDDGSGIPSPAHGGSSDSFGQALDSCRAYLLLVANRELGGDLQAKGAPSDLVQETFLEAQQAFSGFHGKSNDELRAWLRQILINNVSNFARRYRGTTKRQLDREIPLYSNVQFPMATGPSPSTEVAAAERAAAVDAAIARLPDDYRQIIEWRNRDDRSFADIAKLLERSENAVRKLWFRAIEKLKLELGAGP